MVGSQLQLAMLVVAFLEAIQVLAVMAVTDVAAEH
jgi:hypothetical protein